MDLPPRCRLFTTVSRVVLPQDPSTHRRAWCRDCEDSANSSLGVAHAPGPDGPWTRMDLPILSSLRPVQSSSLIDFYPVSTSMRDEGNSTQFYPRPSSSTRISGRLQGSSQTRMRLFCVLNPSARTRTGAPHCGSHCHNLRAMFNTAVSVFGRPINEEGDALANPAVWQEDDGSLLFAFRGQPKALSRLDLCGAHS